MATVAPVHFPMYDWNQEGAEGRQPFSESQCSFQTHIRKSEIFFPCYKMSVIESVGVCH